MSTDRRTFLQLLSTAALSATFPASISRALAIPANNRTGTIKDVEHIIFMMQENRSFDHYFGTLRGVRGHGDPRTIALPNGNQVWHQPNGNNYLLPFHPGAPNLGLQFIEDLAHDWTSTHQAWNAGKYDQWVPNKGTTTMAYLVRSDIPYHYALADAFTICDAYHCSLLGPTDPNRYYMWTGWVGNDGSGGGPVIDNAELGYGWSTYPELLQKAGVTWKLYQDIGDGLNAAGSWGFTSDAYIGNYGDNSLLYFVQYQNAPAGSPLANGAKTGTNIAVSGTLFDEFRQDVSSGKLPQVSWIVAPEAYTEHPNWPANYGAWYISQMLDILTENPDVWSKTVFIITFDENDGFFDHMPPITAPVSPVNGISTVDTTNELFQGTASYPPSEFPVGPYGMGVRVPMLAVSPWSKGGWVNSQVFDHTSLIRFIEARFADEYPRIIENNITPWRRAVAGDLTSAFDFQNPNDRKTHLPSTIAYQPPDDQRHPSYVPTPPAVQTMPQQESGVRPARAVPYECQVQGEVVASQDLFKIEFANNGKSAVVYQVYSSNGEFSPRTYTVGPKSEVSDTWDYGAIKLSQYSLLVFGPNGFYRVFAGSFGAAAANLRAQVTYDIPNQGLHLEVTNHGNVPTQVSLFDYYTQQTTERSLGPKQSFTEFWSLVKSHGWYDITIGTNTDSTLQKRLAGHLETGEDSVTDPAFGSSLTATDAK
jgi:phospholipase C